MSTEHNEPTNPYTSGQPPQYSGQHPNQYPNQYPGQNQQFGGAPGYPAYGYNPQQAEGAQLAQTSMILGIISLFVVGIILGPIAIVKAKKAEREFNTDATVGKVTGWIGTIFGILGVLYIIFIIVVAFSFAGTSMMYSDYS
jgi:hypothetical protein